MNKRSIPTFVKFSYRNQELLWLKVDKFENNYYYGYVDNKPVSKGIAYNQHIRIHKNKLINAMM